MNKHFYLESKSYSEREWRDINDDGRLLNYIYIYILILLRSWYVKRNMCPTQQKKNYCIGFSKRQNWMA